MLRGAARIWFRVRGRLHRIWGRAALAATGAIVGKNLDVLGAPIVSMEQGSEIRIGDRVVLCSLSSHTALGVAHPVVLRTLRAGASVTIGNDTGLSGGTVCAATSVTIGQRCLFGANAQVVDTDFHYVDPEDRRYGTDESRIAAAPVIIGDDVFLGTNSIVLKGVTVGSGAIVGAGSIVTHDVPAGAIVAGVPARVVGWVSDAHRQTGNSAHQEAECHRAVELIGRRSAS
jgi:acetyltransferase-like isoleucine patch superfamily enzyme